MFTCRRPCFCASRSAAVTSLVDPYGPHLKGYDGIGNGCPRLPEPSQVWLSILTDAVPFKSRVLCVFPDNCSSFHAKAMVKHAVDKGFPSPSSSVAWCLSKDLEAHCHHVLQPASVERSRKPWSARKQNESSELAQWSEENGKKYDVVVFAADSLSTVIQLVPQKISAAHSLLTPTVGTLAVWGTHSGLGFSDELRGLEKAVDDVGKLLLDEAEKRRLRDMSFDDDFALRLKQIKLASASRKVEHRDLFLPFDLVKRRSFTSQYHMKGPEILALLCAQPEFALSAQIRRIQKSLPAESSSETAEAAIGEQVVQAPISFRAPVVMAVNAGKEKKYRLTQTPKSPLEVVEQLLADEGRDRTFRVEVSHFVITCSNRPTQRRHAGLEQNPNPSLPLGLPQG